MSFGETSKLSKVMDILGNAVRRRIIRKLSEGPDYTLRMSRELQIGQQLASKHLKLLEDTNLVDVSWEESGSGAKRKMYSLNKFYSVNVDFAPNLYNESLISFEDPLEWFEDSSELDEIEDKLSRVIEEAPSTGQLSPLHLLVSEVDEELNSMEKKRAKLLYIRNLAMKEASKSMGEMERSEKQLVHHIINKGPSSVEDLSKHLRIREETVRKLLRRLKRRDLVGEEGKEIRLQT